MNNKTVYNMSDQSNLDDPIIDYSITGPGWKTFASIDSEIFETEQARCLEVATQAIEKFAKGRKNYSLGPLLGVKNQSTEKEYCVNTYIILLNASKYKHAELLRETYKEQSGTDLADDIHWASQ